MLSLRYSLYSACCVSVGYGADAGRSPYCIRGHPEDSQPGSTQQRAFSVQYQLSLGQTTSIAGWRQDHGQHKEGLCIRQSRVPPPPSPLIGLFDWFGFGHCKFLPLCFFFLPCFPSTLVSILHGLLGCTFIFLPYI